MNTLPVLIKREYWENRAYFLYIPAVMAAVFLVILLVLFAGLSSDSVNVNVDADWDTGSEQHTLVIEDSSLMDLFGVRLQQLEQQPESVRRSALDQLFQGVSVIWFGTLWFIMLLYLLDCLRADRKDRSVLFWKSLPVSDLLTVASKLAAALVAIPLVYYGFIILVHLMLLVAATLAAAGTEIDIWQTLWVSSDLFGRWLRYLGAFLLTVLSCWSLFGWLLLVSSWSRSAPLFVALGVPLLIGLGEALFLGGGVVTGFFLKQLWPSEVWSAAQHLLQGDAMATPLLLHLGASLVLGSVLMALAVWQRGQAYEI